MEKVGRIWCRAALACWIALGSAAHGLAQSPELIAAFDGLLEELDPETTDELLERLGPAPSLAELLVPLGPDFVPLSDRQLPAAVVEELTALTALRDAQENPADAIAPALRVAEFSVERLGADHPRAVAAHARARELEALALLNEEDQQLCRELDSELLKSLHAYRKGKLDEAIEIGIELLLMEYDLLGESGSLADPLGTMAAFLYEKGDYLRGERAARAAFEFALAEAGMHDRRMATALNNLASLTTIMRRLGQARQFHAHSLAVRREVFGDQAPQFAQALLQLAGLYRLSDDFDSGARVVDRAIAILETTGADRDRLGILLTERGVLEWLAGKDSEARASLLRSIELLRSFYSGDHTTIADAIGMLADLERGQGQYARSLDLARENYEMQLRLQSPGSPQLGTPLRRLGLSKEVMGDYEGAEKAYRTALAWTSPQVEGYVETRTALLLGLSGLLARKGDDAGAKELSEQAMLDQRGRFGRSRLFTGVLRREARRKLLSGALEGARAELHEALDLCRELLGTSHRHTQRVLVDLAAVHVELGELDKAEALLSQVLPGPGEVVQDEGGVQGEAHQLAGSLAWQRGDLELAARHGQIALRLRTDLVAAPHPSLVESQVLLGQIAEAQGDLERAREAYGEALGQAAALRTRIAGDERDRALYAGRLSIGRIARTLALVHLAQGHPQAALDAAEQGRERALLDLLQRAGTDLVAMARKANATGADRLERQVQASTRAEQRMRFIEQELRSAGVSSGTTMEALEELEARLSQARQAWSAIEGELESSLREVWPSAEPLSAKAVIATLGPTEAMLHYTVEEDGVGLIALRGRAAGSAEAPVWFGERIAVGRSEAQAFHGALLSFIESVRGGGGVKAGLRESLSEQLVPASAWEMLAGCERIVIVPDGALHELPFECLNTPSGSWLEHGPHLVYSPSASLFARERSGRKPAPSGTPRALVLGNPSFASALPESPGATVRGPLARALEQLRARYRGHLEALPGTEFEAQRIAQTLGQANWNVQTLLGPDARRANLQSAAPGATLVHLATHGFAAEEERPYESALALAWNAEQAEAGDGSLTLDDLIRGWGGRLQGCDLVVLSACDTQVGVVLGESRVALSWGFFFAGADSVLVSLWKVDDRATTLLMDRFYSNYVGSFQTQRRAGASVYMPGEAMDEAAALLEAKAWLAASTPEENRALLKELGFEGAEGGAAESTSRGQFPRPPSGPSSRSTLDAYDFRAARFGAAFVLYGQPD